MAQTWMHLLAMVVTAFTSVPGQHTTEVNKIQIAAQQVEAPLILEDPDRSKSPLLVVDESENSALRMALMRHSSASPAYEANGRIAGRSEKSRTMMIVDRLEENDVVLEGAEGLFRVPRSVLPVEMQVEGAVLAWQYDRQETEERRAVAIARLERMQRMQEMH